MYLPIQRSTVCGLTGCLREWPMKQQHFYHLSTTAQLYFPVPFHCSSLLLPLYEFSQAWPATRVSCDQGPFFKKNAQTTCEHNLNINSENSPPSALKTNHWTTTEQTILLLRFRQTTEWLAKRHYQSQLYFTQYLTIHRAHSFCP